VGVQDSTLTFRSALRQVMECLPEVRPVSVGAALSLERVPANAEAPHLAEAELVEHPTMRSRSVTGGPQVGFAAFLDGTQESQVLAWTGAVPLVHGRVAAAIRVRTGRRLVTWGAPLVEGRIYAPLAYAAGASLVKAFPASAVVDTTAPDANEEMPKPHPMLLLERARSAVARDRERLERRLAERWCMDDTRPLLIDGGIGASDAVAQATCAVGVVKSHRALYVDGPALDTVLALAAGERSTVIRIAPRGRSSVLSWYLRLRSHAGRDALWSLVRVEVADTERLSSPVDTARVTARADQVSRWILAELAPISLPDPRWDKMVYGVRNAEEFLKAMH
jgi:hypothetical protein